MLASELQEHLESVHKTATRGARQYTGTSGRIENAQMGVFLTYASLKGSSFLDRQLYLSQEWTDDSFSVSGSCRHSCRRGTKVEQIVLQNSATVKRLALLFRFDPARPNSARSANSHCSPYF